jgi:hypothetical protein
MRARIEARSFTPLCQQPNKQLQRTVTRNRWTAQRVAAELRRYTSRGTTWNGDR